MDGAPCWAELDVEDPEAVTAFYAAVLGWSVDAGVGADHQHRIVRRDEHAVGAFGSPGVAAPPAWTLYLRVDDVDAAAESLAELGGEVLHGPEDDHDGGRFLVATDAGAAVVGLWESDHDVPAPGPGRLCWAEAASAEPGTTRSFYTELLGWRWAEDGAGPGHLAGGGGDGPVAGLGLAGDALPHWLPVFAVRDADAAVRAAAEAGGEVVVPVDAGPRGRQATLADPGGARFGVLEIG
ncbi:VOC family protein [Actinomycetospora rhizophila]|uniref:VOC family protein n=1 Tax=Actinomycetospora rhizophila TaxID=1416876 RepID=A0ABV9ZK77_9PSEU